ncbi:hypothetical protein [Streptomyces sp. NPDC058872]|uniref:hypothetical protein n=1 Tax=Streptomyces sp. NPDC058872 TaxID=3346661 RepID=UPI00369E142B
MGWFSKWLEDSDDDEERSCEIYHLSDNDLAEAIAVAQDHDKAMPNLTTCKCGYYPATG